MMHTHTRSTYRLRTLSVLLIVATSLFATATQSLAQATHTFTALAGVKGQTAIGDAVPITFVVTRYTTDAENAALSSALKRGAPELHALFTTMPDIGRIEINGRTIPLKYAYRRPGNVGRTITFAANVASAFLDPAAGQEDKPKEDFDFTIATLDFSLPGFGAGELHPAVKLGVNASGLLFAEQYSAATVRLSNVQKQ